MRWDLHEWLPTRSRTSPDVEDSEERKDVTGGTMRSTGDATAADPDRPLVTAVVTTYNRPSYLRDSVESVLAQTYDRIELVVGRSTTTGFAGWGCHPSRTSTGLE